MLRYAIEVYHSCHRTRNSFDCVFIKILLVFNIEIIMSSIEAPKPSYDHFIKMIIIGNSGVGKTNILMRFCDEKYK
jgi:hypothetical protein